MVPPQMINHPRVFFAVKSLNQETYHSPGGFRHVPAEAGSESVGFHGDLLGFKQWFMVISWDFMGSNYNIAPPPQKILRKFKETWKLSGHQKIERSHPGGNASQTFHMITICMPDNYEMVHLYLTIWYPWWYSEIISVICIFFAFCN